MKNTLLAKTLTASLPGTPQDVFARISDPENLPSWHSSFCRSVRKENGSIIAESPRGPVPVRFIRADHSLVLDILIEVKEGVELLGAIRLLPNGDGTEIVWTLVKAEGIPDAVFHEQLRWVGSALHNLRKAPALKPVIKTPALEIPETFETSEAPEAPQAPSTLESAEPLQAPSSAEVSSMPLSGKKLFIGNLSYDWTDEQLRAHFAETGAVITTEIARFRGRGGRSRGFGFVEMATEPDAQAAIEKLHGSLAGGRQLIVRLAKSQEPRPPQTASEPALALAADSSTDAIEPGNERVPRPSTSRPRIERPRRGGGRSRPNASSDRTGSPYAGRGPGRSSSSAPRAYQEKDFVNKSGYEIFPRRAAGQPAPERVDSPAPVRSSLEASPYMEDTGDIENHGRRPPARRRRR